MLQGIPILKEENFEFCRLTMYVNGKKKKPPSCHVVLLEWLHDLDLTRLGGEFLDSVREISRSHAFVVETRKNTSVYSLSWGMDECEIYTREPERLLDELWPVLTRFRRALRDCDYYRGWLDRRKFCK